MKYRVRATEMNFLSETEIEADNEDEARELYREKWENGQISSDDIDLEITVERRDSQ